MEYKFILVPIPLPTTNICMPLDAQIMENEQTSHPNKGPSPQIEAYGLM